MQSIPFTYLFSHAISKILPQTPNSLLFPFTNCLSQYIVEQEDSLNHEYVHNFPKIEFRGLNLLICMSFIVFKAGVYKVPYSPPPLGGWE